MEDFAREGYDYRRHDRIWQRVAPSLAPFPELRQDMAVPAAGGMGTGQSTTQAPAPAAPVPVVPAGNAAANGEETLPGAVGDPCCMGSAARDDLAVLEGFWDQELADLRYYQAMQRCGPASARPVLRELAGRKLAHSQYLGAVYYLITGQCRREIVDCQRIYVGAWCPALRQRYHEEACAALNYLRAAEGTMDPCLQKVYRRLSEESYQQAERVTGLLERALNGTCTRPGMGV